MFFLASQGSKYFVNHTASSWSDNQCCLFQKVSTFQYMIIILYCLLNQLTPVSQGLGAIPPDWMKSCQYNGTQKINVSVLIYTYPLPSLTIAPAPIHSIINKTEHAGKLAHIVQNSSTEHNAGVETDKYSILEVIQNRKQFLTTKM